MMDSMKQHLDALIANVTAYAPKILAAFAILLVGWIVASLIKAALRRFFAAVKLNERLATASGTSMDAESGVAAGAYYIVLLLVAVAVVNALNLTHVSGPIQELINPLLGYLPNLIGGFVLIALAWVLATLVRKLLTKAIAVTSLDNRVAAENAQPMSEVLGTLGYWFVFLLFLPAVLGALELHGLLAPVQEMMETALGAIPHIFKAVVIGVVGFFVARILRDILTNVLSSAGVDKIGANIGMKESSSLSAISGKIVQTVVLVFALIQALAELQMDAITKPATDMLNAIVGALPHVIAASLIIGIAVFIGRLIIPLVVNVLTALGLDSLPEIVGLPDLKLKNTPSQWVGKLMFFFLVLFSVVEGANRLGLPQVSETVNLFITFGGNVLLGSVILVVGFILARLAHDAIVKVGGEESALLGQLARVAIIGLVLGMGLGAMGIADNIVNMAFGFTLGSVAIAFALAFGLGGREPAQKVADRFFSRFLK